MRHDKEFAYLEPIQHRSLAIRHAVERQVQALLEPIGHPTIVLCVEMMDQDHLRIEKMSDAASQAPDEGLPVLYRDIAKELAAHFAREEDFLRKKRFPGLNCHLAQHNVLLSEMAHGEPPKSAGAELRQRMLFVMSQLVLSHVTTTDRMAAAFLKGKLKQTDFDVSRLPLPGLAE
jgi:hemerythrin-like metal-binding protein